MSDDRITRLVHDVVEGRTSRRVILQRAAALGISVPMLSVMVAAAQEASPAAELGPVGSFQDTSNPLGVDPAAPLDVVIFKGGYSDEYAIYVKDNMYAKLYPEAEITYAGIQRLGEQLQPRFVAGEPPDIIDNSGAGNLDMTALIADEQLADLADLMSAPSYDTEGVTFADSLVPGTQDTEVYDGKQLALNLALSAYAVWYSSTLFEEKGWTYPTTWEEHLAFCEQVKSEGMAPWLTTGVHPQYALGFLFNQMLWKQNPQAIIDIDNLVDDAWLSDSVATVAAALKQLGDNDYIGAGWEGLDHVQSQAEWIQGKAVFLPCGTWLENEMKDTLAEVPDFNMVIAPTPSLPNDQIPFEGIFAGAGEGFIVPSQAKNVQGGKEFLRLLFSREGGRTFATLTKSLTVVQGSGDGLDLGTAFASTQEVIAAAGANTFQARYGGWYPSFENEAKLVLADLMQKKIEVEEFQETVQGLADDLKADDSIPKFSR